MDVETYWSVIGAERRSLAELLASLTDQQWATPSLCAGWRVRDVAAHVALVPNAPGLLELIVGVGKVGGNPNRFNHDLAVRHADRPTAEIVAELRDHADSRKLSPPTTAPNLALDILVHGQDIAIPLGLSRPMPLVPAGAAVTRVWGMGFPFWARRRFRGFRLTATDLDWSAGVGAEIRGPISAQLLLLTGRLAALTMLDGDGADAIRARHRLPSP